MTISDPRHPIWPLLRLVIQMAGATAMLAIFASKFDETEIAALAGILGTNVVAHFLRPKGGS